jgi:hypothetical protein
MADTPAPAWERFVQQAAIDCAAEMYPAGNSRDETTITFAGIIREKMKAAIQETGGKA